MKILLASDDWRDPRLGASRAPLELQRELRLLGHDCDVWLRPELGIRPRGERLRLAFAPLLAARALALARATTAYDIVDVAGAEGWLIAARARRHHNRPTVIARSHGLEHIHYRELVRDHHTGGRSKAWPRRLWYPAVRLPQVAAAVRLADAAVVLSQAERDFILARGWKRPDQLAVIPHGTHPEDGRAAPSADAPRGAGLLFCGSWYAAKGTRYLVAAHARLAASGLALPLTVLGGGLGSLDALRARVLADFAAALQPLVTVLPRLDWPGVLEQYRRHDLLVCPSTAEGFGLVVIEALSQRLPVVCSAAVGAAEWLRPDHDALIVATRDAAALAAALRSAWLDCDLRRRLAASGYARAAALTWRHTAELTLDLYATARDRRAS